MKKPTKAATSKKKSSAKSKPANASSQRKHVNPNDIVELILKDHKEVRPFLELMKDSDSDLGERLDAFEQFAPRLAAHARAEETTIYKFLKADENLREEGFEAAVEHQLVDQMMEEAKRSEDDDQLAAMIKVLAELVEHHIEEEEGEILPRFQRECASEDRIKMGQRFLQMKRQIEENDPDANPAEWQVDQHSARF